MYYNCINYVNVMVTSVAWWFYVLVWSGASLWSTTGQAKDRTVTQYLPVLFFSKNDLSGLGSSWVQDKLIKRKWFFGITALTFWSSLGSLRAELIWLQIQTQPVQSTPWRRENADNSAIWKLRYVGQPTSWAIYFIIWVIHLILFWHCSESWNNCPPWENKQTKRK